MIRSFSDISEKELLYLRTHPIEVFEKLDMIRFNIEIGNDSVVTKTAKGVVIDDVDCIVNTVMGDISSFVRNVVEPKADKIVRKFGECTINMFYAPTNKPRVIDYQKIGCPIFIVANVVARDCSAWVEKMNFLFSGEESVRVMEPTKLFVALPDDVDPALNPVDNVTKLMGGRTWSGNDIDKIEGCIIQCGKRRTYQIVVNETRVEIDKTTKKIYRDMVLDNFCNIIMQNNHLVDDLSSDSDGYVDLMSKLFILYLDNTNILSRVAFDEDDLLPPTVGYIGDVDYDRLPVTVRYICKTNHVYKNILRIILVAFDPNKADKIKDDQDVDYKKILSLKERINKMLE